MSELREKKFSWAKMNISCSYVKSLGITGHHMASREQYSPFTHDSDTTFDTKSFRPMADAFTFTILPIR